MQKKTELPENITGHFETIGIANDPGLRPEGSFGAPASSFFTRLWARCGIKGYDPIAYIDLYAAEINPRLVVASVLYEKSMVNVGVPRIIDAGIIKQTGQAYIIREYVSDAETGFPADEKALCAFLRCAADILHQIEQRRTPEIAGKFAAHGFLCPQQVLRTTSEEIQIGGINNNYLHYLLSKEPEASSLLEGDAGVNRYRVFRKRKTQILSAELDVESLLLMALEMAPRNGSQMLDALSGCANESSYNLCVRDCIKRYPYPGLRDVLFRGLYERKTVNVGDLSGSLAAIAAKAPAVFTAPRLPAHERILDSCPNIDPESVDMLRRKMPYLKYNERDKEHDKDRKPLLIVGATGTGKTRIARLIHASLYNNSEFYHINCGAFSDDDKMHSEIFGHVTGAFTGAIKDREGPLAACKNGTVFLDDVQNLSLDGQARLLQLFEEGYTFYPLGSDTPKHCNATLILATNIDPAVLIRSGKLFEDFFYRVSGFMVLQLKPFSDDRTARENALASAWKTAQDSYPGESTGAPRDMKTAFPDAWNVFVNAPCPGNYRTILSYALDAVFKLKINREKTGRWDLSAKDAQFIVHDILNLSGTPCKQAAKTRVDLARDARELLEYLKTAEDKYNRTKAAGAIGHVRADGTGLTSRINELIRQIKAEQKKDISRRTVLFTESEWETLFSFSQERRRGSGRAP